MAVQQIWPPNYLHTSTRFASFRERVRAIFFFFLSASYKDFTRWLQILGYALFITLYRSKSLISLPLAFLTKASQGRARFPYSPLAYFFDFFFFFFSSKRNNFSPQFRFVTDSLQLPESQRTLSPLYTARHAP